MRLFLCYDRCSTCKKARAWLDRNKIDYTPRPIREERPTEDELAEWIRRSGKPASRFFNTSGQLYKAQNLKEKIPCMTEEEQIALLASDGMLVRRPLLVTDEIVLVGFREAEWAESLL